MSDRFNNLQVSEVRRETSDCVSVVLQVPEDLQEAYAFKQGQYLTFDQDINGEACAGATAYALEWGKSFGWPSNRCLTDGSALGPTRA